MFVAVTIEQYYMQLRETVVLQMLHVAVGLLLLSKVISTLQTFCPQVCQSNVTRVSEFCHKLCSDVKKKKKRKRKIWAWVHVQSAEKYPDQPILIL